MNEPVEDPSKFQTGRSCGFLGTKDTVRVLARKFSAVPSIQTYIHCTLSSGCVSDMYLARMPAFEQSDVMGEPDMVQSFTLKPTLS